MCQALSKCFKCFVSSYAQILLFPLFTEEVSETQGIEVLPWSHMLVNGNTSLTKALSPCVILSPAGSLGRAKPHIESVIKKAGSAFIYEVLPQGNYTYILSH